MKLVVLTGGIACGKSTVSDIFRHKHNFCIIDLDKITHDLQKKGNVCYKILVKSFGEEILDKETREIDRRVLGSIIFSNEEKRRLLNKIMHPKIFKSMIYSIFINWIKNKKVIVLDIPLFFETKMPRFCFNEIITVCTDPDIQKKRLMQRNSLSEKDADERISKNIPLSIKKSLSTFVIENNDSMEHLTTQVDEIAVNLKKKRLVQYPGPIGVIIFGILVFVLIFMYR